MRVNRLTVAAIFTAIGMGLCWGANTVADYLRPTLSPTAAPTRIVTIPLPTLTETPPELVLTFVSMETHNVIWLGDETNWYPGQGNVFIDLGVLVENSGPPLTVEWQQIGFKEQAGNWYPSFGGSEPAGKVVDPMAIQLARIEPTDTVTFVGKTYLRAVTPIVETKQTVEFWIADSRPISFDLP